MTFENNQSKKSNPKTKGSVLSTSLVLKNFLKQKPNPPTQQNKHHKKRKKKPTERKPSIGKKRKD
ncbi:hypothetical protein HpMS158_02380 [Helicobacter pylori]